MCPLKVDLLFVTFDAEAAEIRWLIVTHPMKILFVIAGLPTQRPLNSAQPNFEGLRGLLSTVKIWGNSSPKISPQTMLKFLTTFFATFSLDTAYFRNGTSYLQCVPKT